MFQPHSRTTLLAAAACALTFSIAPQAHAQKRTYQTKELKSGILPANGWLKSGPFVTVRPDCSGSDTAAVRIVRKPRHGKLRLFVGRGRIYFRDRKPIRRCNELPVTGSFVGYRANSNYRGPDTFQVQLRFVDGERRLVTYRLHVR
jgi:hypothetical protein